MPLAEGDLPVVATAGDAGRPALLLPTTQTIRKSVVGGDVVHLRRRLVVPVTPGLTAIHADDSTLVAADKKNVGIVGIDPDVLVVVTSRRTAQRVPGLTT